MQLKQLGGVLAGIDLAPLGDWTWILVRSQDWKPILRGVGRDPDSPAFTILERRQTFLEEALFNAGPERSRTLLEKYRIPLDQFLCLQSPMSWPCFVPGDRRSESDNVCRPAAKHGQSDVPPAEPLNDDRQQITERVVRRR